MTCSQKAPSRHLVGPQFEARHNETLPGMNLHRSIGATSKPVRVFGAAVTHALQWQLVSEQTRLWYVSAACA